MKTNSPWIRILPLAIMVAMVHVSCGQKAFEKELKRLYKETVPLVKSEELTNSDLEEYYILDIRSPEEYEISHLPESRMLNFETFSPDQVIDIPKDAKVLVYCSVGYRSERAGEQLQEAGYQNVQNLYGGIFDWKNKGKEVVNPANVPTDSVHTYNLLWSRWLQNGIKVY
ncbi:MAG: rhodanese-like domain-containing protein [Cytophagales bacterium]|nr:rhodanese-like domain-containing protein [Cytophagales bacterium]